MCSCLWTFHRSQCGVFLLIGTSSSAVCNGILSFRSSMIINQQRFQYSSICKRLMCLQSSQKQPVATKSSANRNESKQHDMHIYCNGSKRRGSAGAARQHPSGSEAPDHDRT